jgi:hypothetical protein
MVQRSSSKKIRIVDVIYTVNKPICTTQLQQDTAWETLLNVPGYIFKHQGYLYNQHLHRKRIVHVECDTECQWNLNRTQLRTAHRLLRGRPLRDHPEKLYVDKPTRAYIDSIEKSEPLTKGKHVHREGYNCLTRYPIKCNTVRVNQVTGHVQFGDITVYESSYKDFLLITDPLVKPPKKKLNVPFTVSQNQSYYFRVQWIPSTRFGFVDGKQSIDFLDNNTLVPW